MTDRLISGDNHIDLTYCPPDLWSAKAPAKWKLLVPRVEELDHCRLLPISQHSLFVLQVSAMTTSMGRR